MTIGSSTRAKTTAKDWQRQAGQEDPRNKSYLIPQSVWNHTRGKDLHRNAAFSIICLVIPAFCLICRIFWGDTANKNQMWTLSTAIFEHRRRRASRKLVTRSTEDHCPLGRNANSHVGLFISPFNKGRFPIENQRDSGKTRICGLGGLGCHFFLYILSQE